VAVVGAQAGETLPGRGGPASAETQGPVGDLEADRDPLNLEPKPQVEAAPAPREHPVELEFALAGAHDAAVHPLD
jgi:hypothetical protein